MSVILCKKIIGLQVVTKSGDILGRVSNFEVEIASHAILRYYVGGNNVFKKIIFDKLIIHRDQVVSIDDKKMLVLDSVVGGSVSESKFVDVTA